MAYNKSNIVSHYTDLERVPMVLSAAFILASLFTFGGIGSLSFNWINYTLTAQHAMLVSLGTYVVAFASSETKEFKRYQDFEKVLIAAGPAVIICYEYAVLGITWSQTLQMGAFGLTLVSWMVAIR